MDVQDKDKIVSLEDLKTAYDDLDGDISDLKNTLNHKADVIYDTASGDIASFPDGAYGLPVKDLTVSIEPVQDTSGGDPSPTHICPISGWTVANVNAAGENIWGGLKFANDIVAAVNNSSYAAKGENANGKYVKLQANNAIANKLFFSSFKEETQYTFIFKFSKSNTNAAINIIVKYTDGTYSIVSYSGTVVSDTVYTGVFVTASGKTVSSIVGSDVSGIVLLYYEQCGLFEGVLTAADFAPYHGQTIPISWQSSAGTVYGGTLDVTSGVLTVTNGYVDLGTLDWVYRSDLGQGVFGNQFNTISNYLHKSSVSFTCSAYKAAGTVLAGTFMSSKPDKSIVLYYNSGNDSSAMYVKDTAYSDDAIFKAAMSGVQLVYELATPQTYQLDPVTVTTLLGQNNIWADTGDSTVEYPCDMKLYIERLTAPEEDDMIANQNIASGVYFMVGNNLYLSTAAILAGDPIKPGTNCTLTNLAAALNALNS